LYSTFREPQGKVEGSFFPILENFLVLLGITFESCALGSDAANFRF